MASPTSRTVRRTLAYFGIVGWLRSHGLLWLALGALEATEESASLDSWSQGKKSQGVTGR